MLGSKFVEVEVPRDDLIVSHTDLRGIITYANDTFAKISGYEAPELIGKAHNILRHPDMPSSLFKNLWESVKEDRLWSGYVKNKTKNGGYYWVYAQVSPLFKDGEKIGYKSLREPVEKQKRNELEEAYIALKEMEEGKMKLNIWLDSAVVANLIKTPPFDGEEAIKKFENALRECANNGGF